MIAADPITPEARRSGLRIPRPLWFFVATVMLIAAVIGLRFGLPFYWRWAAVLELDRLGLLVHTSPTGPEWLRRSIGNEWMASLFDEVNRIDRVDSQVADENLVHLRGFPKLEALQLRGSQITDTGMFNFAGLKSLKNLWLDQTNVGDDGLASLKNLTSLETLSLSDTHLTDAGLVHLQRLTNLQEISLAGTNVSDAGLVHLRGLTNLQTIRLRRTKVTQTGIAELKRVLPRLRVLADLDRASRAG